MLEQIQPPGAAGDNRRDVHVEKTAFRRRCRSVALTVGAAQAEDLKEFRIGILGGENEADRLRNNQCLIDHFQPRSASRRCRCSRPPTMTA